jgi:hypothetical protein
VRALGFHRALLCVCDGGRFNEIGAALPQAGENGSGKKEDRLVFSSPDEATSARMLEISYWYQYFIAKKIHRGLSGVFDGNFDENEINDPQSATNSSIKIALIAVERSIIAWTALVAKGTAPQIKPLALLLETIRQKAEKKFPFAKDFIRPGFDEVEGVMKNLFKVSECPLLFSKQSKRDLFSAASPGTSIDYTELQNKIRLNKLAESC